MRNTSSTIASARCTDGYYWTNNSCLPCSTCSINETLLQPCSISSNTVCFQCNTSHLQYVARTSSASQCKNCTVCADFYRKEVTPCGPRTNTVCGGCINGYFLGISDEGAVKCLPCSWCPPGDDTAIKWKECQDAGLPRNMWCSPGESIPYIDVCSPLPFRWIYVFAADVMLLCIMYRLWRHHFKWTKFYKYLNQNFEPRTFSVFHISEHTKQN